MIIYYDINNWIENDNNNISSKLPYYILHKQYHQPAPSPLNHTKKINKIKKTILQKTDNVSTDLNKFTKKQIVVTLGLPKGYVIGNLRKSRLGNIRIKCAVRSAVPYLPRIDGLFVSYLPSLMASPPPTDIN